MTVRKQPEPPKTPVTAPERDRAGPDSGDEDAFLSRWARRKSAARRGADARAPRPGEPAPPTGEAGAEAGAPPAAAAAELTDADMPPLETLDENSDYSGFMSPKVSQALRRAALRKLFHSPAFNVVDGLNDYDDDFTTFHTLGDIVTTEMRLAAQRRARQAEEKLKSLEGDGPQDAATEEAAGARPDDRVPGGTEPDPETEAESDRQIEARAVGSPEDDDSDRPATQARRDA